MSSSHNPAAQAAFARGQKAEADDDHIAAERHYEHAQRLAPEDDDIALALGLLRLNRKDARAAEPLELVARRHDLRDAWIALAALHIMLKQAHDAAWALGEALARNSLPREANAHILATAVVRLAGLPGWSSLSPDGTLRICLAPGGTRKRLSIALDGRPIPVPAKLRAKAGVLELAMPAGWQHARQLELQHDGIQLLGSPIDAATIGRIEGFVQAIQGGLQGWAWYPADPAVEPVLTIADGTARPQTVVAHARAWIEHPRPLAFPRAFSLPAEQAARFAGAVTVCVPDGRSLTGSPLDPGAEWRSAAAAAEAVRRLFPASGPPLRRNTALPELPAVPADIVGAPARGNRRRRPVAVVIPVYRGLRQTMDCIDSVLATVGRSVEVIVIDDQSPEAKLVAALRKLARDGRIRLHRNRRNLGFPGSANCGVRLAGEADVVLLNSDTLCPPGWLERLRAAAYSAGDVGTVTPLSNDATIMSYPSIEAVNPVPNLAQTVALDRLAHEVAGAELVDLPTGIGFCWFLRRDCVEQVGLLRGDVFAQGYGEENDFCLRARQLGWRHVGLPGLFIGHVGGQSFGATKQQLIERNLRVLNRLHPGYDALIQEWLAADPMAPVRRRLDMRRWAEGARAQATVLISHDRLGGVLRRVTERCAELAAGGTRPVLLSPARLPDGRRGCRVSEGATQAYPNLVFAMPAEADALVTLLRADRPNLVELHHYIGHDPAVLQLAARLDVPHVVVLHDYSWFCPRINLVGGDRRYCGEPDLRGCETCITDHGTTNDDAIRPAELIARSAALLGKARDIVAPSADTARRYRRHFPALRPRPVPPEDDTSLAPPRAPRDQGAPVRAAVVGAVGIEKGFDFMLACARDAAARRLALEFVLIGYSCDDARLLETGRVVVTGPYEQGDGPALVRQMDADLGFLPSLWPETWCYVLSEAWQAGLSVLAFDLGAPSERIRATGRGWLLPLGATPGIVNNALLAAGRQARAAG